VTPVRLVLLDVDFTLVEPGPEFGADGYAAMARRLGVRLDPARWHDARAAAAALHLAPRDDLRHDAGERLRFPAAVARGMGADPDGARRIAEAACAAWDDPSHFRLYPDVLPALAALRRAGAGVGLVSNTHRDLPRFLAPLGVRADFALASGTHGRLKPCPTIFAAALAAGRCDAASTVMVGDSLRDDVEGALACGIRGVLLDRHDVVPRADVERVRALTELPALLGLAPAA
jgi:putative hydrolase of the HAD superfamily